MSGGWPGPHHVVSGLHLCSLPPAVLCFLTTWRHKMVGFPACWLRAPVLKMSLDSRGGDGDFTPRWEGCHRTDGHILKLPHPHPGMQSSAGPNWSHFISPAAQGASAAQGMCLYGKAEPEKENVPHRALSEPCQPLALRPSICQAAGWNLCAREKGAAHGTAAPSFARSMFSFCFPENNGKLESN